MSQPVPAPDTTPGELVVNRAGSTRNAWETVFVWHLAERIPKDVQDYLVVRQVVLILACTGKGGHDCSPGEGALSVAIFGNDGNKTRIRRALRWLRREGWITRTRGRNRTGTTHTTDVYRVSIPADLIKGWPEEVPRWVPDKPGEPVDLPGLQTDQHGGRFEPSPSNAPEVQTDQDHGSDRPRSRFRPTTQDGRYPESTSPEKTSPEREKNKAHTRAPTSSTTSRSKPGRDEGGGNGAGPASRYLAEDEGGLPNAVYEELRSLLSGVYGQRSKLVTAAEQKRSRKWHEQGKDADDIAQRLVEIRTAKRKGVRDPYEPAPFWQV